MPREHQDIKMTPDELRSFLGASSIAVLATLDANGAPWTDLAPCRFEDERLYFSVPVTSRSWANIRRDPRVCCVVEHRPAGSYYGIRGALLHGAAREATTDEATAVAVPGPLPGGGPDGVVLSIDLEDSTSFAFEKIQYRYQDKTVSDLAG